MCVVAAPSREPSFLLSNEELDFSFSAKEKKSNATGRQHTQTHANLLLLLSPLKKKYSADTKALLSRVQQGLYSQVFKP